MTGLDDLILKLQGDAARGGFARRREMPKARPLRKCGARGWREAGSVSNMELEHSLAVANWPRAGRRYGMYEGGINGL